MKRLEDCNWKRFRISDIFNVNTGANVSKSEFNDGHIPRITATDINNGVDYYTAVCSNKNFRVYENVISISFLGSCFYQPYLASYDMKIHSITLKDRILNKYIALFIANQCKRTCCQVTYGNQMSSSDLKSQFVYLPINTYNEPDFVFMENYMREIERKQKERYKNYIQSIIKEVCSVESLENKRWKEFRIEYIFNIFSGVRLTKETQNEGKRPFAGATDSNNGITEFVSNTNESLDQNVLGVNYNGSVVENFYHPYETIFSDDVKRLHLKHYEDNKYVLLFIKSAILKQKVMNTIKEKYGTDYYTQTEEMKEKTAEVS